MTRHFEHPSRASRWHVDKYEVLPAAKSADVTVWFCLPGDPGDEQTWEGLLARSSTPGHAVLASVPAFAYDLHLGDEVAVTASAEGALVATAVVRDAGQYTFRVAFAGHAAASRDDRWERLQKDLEPYGCWFDVISPTLVAISVEPAAAQEVAIWLHAAEQAGHLTYETGRTSQSEPN